MRLITAEMATVASNAPSPKEEIMARFNVTVRSCKPSTRPHFKWVVNAYHPTKGRTRTYFKTKEEAEAQKAVLDKQADEFGTQALELSTSQRITALDAFQKLEPFGITLTAVVDDFVDRRRASTSTFAEVKALYLKSRERLGRSDRHLEGLRSVLGRFAEKHGQKRISDLTTDQVQEWIYEQGVAAPTMNHFRAMLHSVFAWAFMRKMIRENPIKQVERQKVKTGKVEILTPGQLQALLEGARAHPDVLATLVIGAFAGLRPEEVARLKWSAIDLEHGQIDCGSEITKTASHRYVKIEPVLAAWLKIPPFCENLGIQHRNFRKRFAAVRAAAGFQFKDTPGISWPHDGLRHSFASYHYAHFKNAAETAQQLGHSDTAMLFKNYRARVSEKDAAAWWQLMPGGQP
jgi:integrase